MSLLPVFLVQSVKVTKLTKPPGRLGCVLCQQSPLPEGRPWPNTSNRAQLAAGMRSCLNQSTGQMSDSASSDSPDSCCSAVVRIFAQDLARSIIAARTCAKTLTAAELQGSGEMDAVLSDIRPVD